MPRLITHTAEPAVVKSDRKANKFHDSKMSPASILLNKTLLGMINGNRV
ncbi:MAG TPA: hypothetical protein VK835_08315 [Bacteroidia bacterium]|nr:hypothetical protein [Bacteroidia bacterium]